LEEGEEYMIKVVGMGPITYKFIGKETISTPAGDFAAMKWEFNSFDGFVKGATWYSLDEPYILQSIMETIRGTVESKLERIEVGEEVAEIAPLERAEEEEEEIIPKGYTAEEVTFQSDGVTLAGTLTIPEDKILPPGVILIHGSGPVDRDENVPGGLKLRVFAEVADALSKAGFAVLRYDKRGIGESTGSYSKASLSDLVNDVQAAVKFMQIQPGIDMNRIALVGHSEGGIIAPMVSARDSTIKAIVLMAGTARPLDEVVEDQVRYAYAISGIDDEKLIEEGVELQKEMLEAIRAGEDTMNDQPIPLAAWWREHMNHNPLETIVQVNADVLILQGEKDFQVLVDKDAKMLAQALTEAGKPHKIVIFPNLDHLFKYVEGESTVASYLDTSREVSEDVLNTMIEWLKETLK